MEIAEIKFGRAFIRTSDSSTTLTDGTLYIKGGSDQMINLVFDGPDYYVSLRCADAKAFEEDTEEGEVVSSVICSNKKGKEMFNIILEEI